MTSDILVTCTCYTWEVIQKTVSHSIAKHVSFFTEEVYANHHNPDQNHIRLMLVVYMGEAGHVLWNLSPSVNGVAVCAEECTLTKDRINALNVQACLKDRPICQIT